MTRRRWLVLGALAMAGLIVIAAIGRSRDGNTANLGTPLPASAEPARTTTPTIRAIATPTTSEATPSPSASAVAPDPTAAPTPRLTAPPRATGRPRLAYAEFLLRVDDDRSTVDRLNGALTTAADRQDPVAVRHAAVDILDFVDVERDWLRNHPPADCYAAAHASAGAMLDAYGTAADRAVDWSATGGGLAGIPALGNALDAAQAAADALTTFGHVLETTSCPA